jgi:hypothetical protein
MARRLLYLRALAWRRITWATDPLVGRTILPRGRAETNETTLAMEVERARISYSTFATSSADMADVRAF